MFFVLSGTKKVGATILLGGACLCIGVFEVPR